MCYLFLFILNQYVFIRNNIRVIKRLHTIRFAAYLHQNHLQNLCISKLNQFPPGESVALHNLFSLNANNNLHLSNVVRGTSNTHLRTSLFADMSIDITIFECWMIFHVVCLGLEGSISLNEHIFRTTNNICLVFTINWVFCIGIAFQNLINLRRRAQIVVALGWCYSLWSIIPQGIHTVISVRDVHFLKQIRQRLMWRFINILRNESGRLETRCLQAALLSFSLEIVQTLAKENNVNLIKEMCARCLY